MQKDFTYINQKELKLMERFLIKKTANIPPKMKDYFRSLKDFLDKDDKEALENAKDEILKDKESLTYLKRFFALPCVCGFKNHTKFIAYVSREFINKSDKECVFYLFSNFSKYKKIILLYCAYKELQLLSPFLPELPYEFSDIKVAKFLSIHGDISEAIKKYNLKVDADGVSDFEKRFLTIFKADCLKNALRKFLMFNALGEVYISAAENKYYAQANMIMKKHSRSYLRGLNKSYFKILCNEEEFRTLSKNKEVTPRMRLENFCAVRQAVEYFFKI